MNIWKTYPPDYRQQAVEQILAAAQAGECVSVVGLSGAGKSNLMGFLANRPEIFTQPAVLLDCNRLPPPGAAAFFELLLSLLDPQGEMQPGPGDPWQACSQAIYERLSRQPAGLTLLIDRFELLDGDHALSSNLRALRDTYKYRFTLVIASRRPLDPHSELAELFYAHTLWLGPLGTSDSQWNVQRYATRTGQDWGPEIAERMLALTRGYPALLRATCEAHAAGTALELSALRQHPAVQRRLQEFWADQPSPADLQRAGLKNLELLSPLASPENFDTTQLTEKEHLLLQHLQAHPGQVCSKDELVRAVWPEDQIYERGIRDDSLAQLVRRLRLKIEPDPAQPSYIQTVPGRGYLFSQE